MRLHTLLFFAAMLWMGKHARADLLYDYSLGVSLENTVVPGSLVSITAVLLNSGSLPIVFAPSFPGGPPSVQGGSVPFAGIGSSGGEWNVLASGFSFGDFFGQFARVTVAPGNTFQFTVGTFIAPTNTPMGSSARAKLNFGIDFTDTIVGNLESICPGACDYDNGPTLTFTIGSAPSQSDLTFFKGIVVDEANLVPEPPAWILLGTVTAIAAFSVRPRKLISPPS
jgi:hypothetical protein